MLNLIGAAALVLMSTEEQYTRQDALRTTGVAFDAEVQTLGVQALLHCRTHGDYRPLVRLIDCFPQGYRVEGFKVWVSKYSPIRWNGDGQVGLLREGFDKTFTPFDVEGANDNPFWTLKEAKERVVKKLSINSIRAMISAMLADVESADAGGVIHDKEGKPKARIDGSIPDTRAYIARLRAA